MIILWVLVPLSLLLLGLATWAFFWAVDNNQFEQIEQDAQRSLDDEAL